MDKRDKMSLLTAANCEMQTSKSMNDPRNRIGKDLEHAARLISEDKLVAIPTETVYGLAAIADSKTALDNLYKAKGRPSNHPVIVHIPNPSHLDRWAQSPGKYGMLLAEAFWPGPLTLIFQKKDSVLNEVTGGQNTVAIRIPDHTLTLQLLSVLNNSIAAPSANKFGKLSPTSPDDVALEFEEEIAYILDGGSCKVGIESTILDISTDTPTILRPGHISKESIEKLLQVEVKEAFDKEKHQAKTSIRTPGNLSSHYAPNKPLFLVDPNDWSRVLGEIETSKKQAATLSFSKLESDAVDENSIVLNMANEEYASALYSNLRKLDNLECDMILVESPPETSVWTAINDRLKRASKGKL